MFIFGFIIDILFLLVIFKDKGRDILENGKLLRKLELFF